MRTKSAISFFICAYGQCSVTVDDGSTRLEVQLSMPNVGIYLPQMIWGRRWQYSAGAALLVFASELYDPADYIRQYDAFLIAVRVSS
jgi:hypothetical protein